MDGSIGHNMPPEEAHDLALENILNDAEGLVVTNEDQLALAENALASVKAVEKAAKADKEKEFRPAKERADAISERFKPVLDKAAKAKKQIAEAMTCYKVEKARAAEEKRQRLKEEAEAKARAADLAEAATDMTDRDSRKFADDAQLEARQAQREAQAVEQVKGLRTRTVIELSDPAAFWKWLQSNGMAVPLLQQEADRIVKLGQAPDGVATRKEKYAV